MRENAQIKRENQSKPSETTAMDEPRRTSRTKMTIVYAETGTRAFSQSRTVLERTEAEKARAKWLEEVRLVPARRVKALAEICSFFTASPQSSDTLPGKRLTRSHDTLDDPMAVTMQQLKRKWSGEMSQQTKRKRHDPEQEPQTKQRQELSFRQSVELKCTDAPLAKAKQWLEAGLYATSNTKFRLALPANVTMLDTLYNFRLPADIHELQESGVLDDIRSTIAAVPPSKFEKIRKSTSCSPIAC